MMSSRIRIRMVAFSFAAIVSIRFPVLGQGPSIQPPHAFHRQAWRRTFTDDFSGTSLSHCWKNTYNGNVHSLEGNKEAEWYASPGDGTDFNATSVEHGKLVLQAIPMPSRVTLPKKLAYLSGMVMSDGCFAQTYGYFEIRAKVPPGKGLWPAFWLLPASHHWPPEIDVFEMFGAPNSRGEGGAGWVHTGTVHAGERAFTDWHHVPMDQYTSFHRYGLLWGPDRMSIFVDGRQIASQRTPGQYHQPMYLIVNLAVGGEWPELPDKATKFPARMYVDFVRAWQYRLWEAKPAERPQASSAEKP